MRKRRREEELRKAKKRFAVSMTIAVAIITVLTIYMIINLPTGYYRGRYSGILKELFEKIVNDEMWINETIYNPYLREIFYEYYISLYNTSKIFNYTFIIQPSHGSLMYRVFLGANETIYIETYGNDTYYYTISLDIHGKINLLGYAVPGNTSREIAVSDIIEFTIEKYNVSRKTILYNESYLILFTNISRPVTGYIFVNKTPPVNLTSILRVIPIEYTIWLFQNWIKDKYTILTTNVINVNDMIRTARAPWVILGKNIVEITALEACILLHKLYSIVGIETRVIAIDLDGDNEVDHFALAVKYDKTANDYAKIMIDYILNDANIIIRDIEINVKHAVSGDINWIILDPVYESKYIPAHITIKYYYNLGLIH